MLRLDRHARVRIVRPGWISGQWHESGGGVGVLLITCPVSGKEFSTGIETDEQSLDLIPDTVARSFCPHCGDEHPWSTLDVRLSEDGSAG